MRRVVHRVVAACAWLDARPYTLSLVIALGAGLAWGIGGGVTLGFAAFSTGIICAGVIAQRDRR